MGIYALGFRVAGNGVNLNSLITEKRKNATEGLERNGT